MTLGLALILIFILYLIDKHSRWREAAEIVAGLVILGVLVSGASTAGQSMMSTALRSAKWHNNLRFRRAFKIVSPVTLTQTHAIFLTMCPRKKCAGKTQARYHRICQNPPFLVAFKLIRTTNRI
jgi:hypothetical protein